GGLVAEAAQDPLGVEGCRQAPRPAARVAHAKADHLDLIGGRDQDEEVLVQAVAGSREEAIALAMTDDRRRLAPARGRRRRPELPGLLVAEVNDLAERVGHWIVAPRREPLH